MSQFAPLNQTQRCLAFHYFAGLRGVESLAKTGFVASEHERVGFLTWLDVIWAMPVSEETAIELDELRYALRWASVRTANRLAA